MAIVGGPGLVPVRMTSYPNNADICRSGRKFCTDGDEIRWAVVGQLPTAARRTRHANGLDLSWPPLLWSTQGIWVYNGFLVSYLQDFDFRLTH